MNLTPQEVAEVFEEASRAGRKREWFPRDAYIVRAGPVGAPRRVRPPRTPRARYAYTFEDVCPECGLRIECRAGNYNPFHIGAPRASGAQCPARPG